jgi:hypothetical protein
MGYFLEGSVQDGASKKDRKRKPIPLHQQRPCTIKNGATNPDVSAQTFERPMGPVSPVHW